MRFFFLILFLALLPLTAKAVEAPPGQEMVDAHKVLRGHFIEEHQMGDGKMPLRTSGHFVIAPAQGLIWGIEKPFPTLTIVTPDAAAQDLGGMVIKLPAKNLRHLYDMVGGALAGNWNGLANDFDITKNGDAKHWQMLLTPRHTDQPKLPYATITVSGSHFVENIVLAKSDGSYDMFSFTDAVLSPMPLGVQEIAAFNEVGH